MVLSEVELNPKCSYFYVKISQQHKKYVSCYNYREKNKLKKRLNIKQTKVIFLHSVLNREN